MKALIIVTVLAMATSAIAVPLSRQAKAQALLAAMQDNAKMEGWLSDVAGAVGKHAPTVLKFLGSAGLWDEELNRESAAVQEEAEMEGLLSDIGGAVGKYGPTVLKFLGGAGLWDEELERESAAVQEEAEMEGLLSDIGGTVGKYAPSVLKFLGSAGLWDEELNRESAAVQEEAEMEQNAKRKLIAILNSSIAANLKAKKISKLSNEINKLTAENILNDAVGALE